MFSSNWWQTKAEKFLTAAQAAFERDNPSEARAPLQEFLAHLEEADLAAERAAPDLLNWASQLVRPFDPALAVHLLDGAMQILQATGRAEELPFFQYNKGLFLAEMGHIRDAVDSLLECRSHVLREAPAEERIRLNMILGHCLTILDDPAGRDLVLESWRGCESLPANHDLRSEVLLALVDVANECGDLANAIRLLDEFDRTPAARRAQLACRAMNARARWHQLTGDFPGARLWFTRALETVRDASLHADAAVITGMLNLGQFLCLMGDYREAQQLGEDALRHLTENPHPSLQATALHLLSMAAECQGDPRGTIVQYEENITRLEQSLGPNHPFAMLERLQLAKALTRVGQPDRAVELVKAQLPLLRNAREVAKAWDVMGQAYDSMGSGAAAIECWEASLRLFDDGAPIHPETLPTRSKLARAYSAVGRRDAAMREHDRVLELLPSVCPPDQAPALTVLALIAAASGRPDAAREDLKAALDVHQTILPLFLKANSVHRKWAYLQDSRLFLHVALHLCLCSGIPVGDLAWEAVLLLKGRLVDAVRNEWQILRDAAGSDAASIVDEATRLNEQLIEQCFGSGFDIRNFHHVIQRREGLSLALSKWVSGRQIWEDGVSLVALRASVPAGATLIEFVRCERALDFGEDYYAAGVLSPEGGARWVRLPGDAAEIDRLAKAYREAVATAAPDEERLATELHASLLAPLGLPAGGALLIAPDGELNLVPFAALLDEAGTRLLSRYTISYLGSARELLPTADEPWRSPAVLIGAPAYDVGPGGAGAESSLERLGELETQEEIEEIAEYFAKGACRIVLRSSATKEAFREVAGPSLLHVATHGQYSADVPEVFSVFPAEAPLLSSWLAFSGANRAGGALPGRVTALELANFDLRGCRLAVLSACDTGRGAARAGDGVYSMRRALALAGARSQIVTLWQIDDQRTGDLVRELYRGLQAGSTIPEALRAAQLAAGPHPRFWAPFVPSGRPDRIPEVFQSPNPSSTPR